MQKNMFSKACAPVGMAEIAQSEAATPADEEPAFQSTPLKSRLDQEQCRMVLTSPAEAGPSNKPSASGIYIARPPTWRLSQVSPYLYVVWIES